MSDLKEQAESELLELVRGQDAVEFTLIVSRQENGNCVVSIKDPTVPGEPGQGDGASFAEAWHDVKAYWS